MSRPQLQANPTLAAGDVQISKDGGAFANLTTLPAVTPAAGRAVKVDLSATEMTADQVMVQFVDAAGAEWDDLIINIQTAARQIDDLAFPVVSGRGVDVDASGGVEIGSFQAGAIGAAAFAAGAIDAAAIGTGAIDADAFAPDAITAAKIANGAIDAATFAAGAIDAAAVATDAIGSAEFAQAAADKVWASASRALTDKVGFDLTQAAKDDIIKAVSGTADSGTTTTIVDAERTEADTDYWAGSIVVMTSGPAVGQARRITSFVPASDTIVVNPAFTQAIAIGNTYLILRSGFAGVRVDGMSNNSLTEAAIASGAINAAKFAAGAIDAAAIGTGAIDADALATDAITAAKIAANAIGSSELDATAVTKIWDEVIAELTQAIPSATPSARAAIGLLYMALRNKFTITATALKIFNDAGVNIATKTLSDDGTTYQEAEAVAGT